jgi:hypothetical protein
MSFETRTTVVPARVETLPCHAVAFPDQDRSFIWPEYTALFEAMTPNSSKDKHSWKSFEHYKRSVASTTLVECTGAVGNHLDVLSGTPPRRRYDWAASRDSYAWFCNEFGAAGEHLTGLQPLYDPSATGFVPDPDDLEGLKQRSLRTMLPLIKEDLSLINSIIELKDFKSLATHTIPRLKAVGQLLQIDGRVVSAGASLRRILRAAADGYLQAQFNIYPLLSDIAGIYRSLAAVKSQLNALIGGQGHTQKKHFRAPVAVTGSDVEEKVYFSSAPFGYPYGCAVPCGVLSRATRYTYTDVSTFHAEIEYNYNFTQYQTEHAQLLGLLDRFGVNFNPAIIWNAIPWTFVVDWVFGVSRWLNDRRELNMEPKINIHNFLWSYTTRRRILVSRRLERDAIQHDIDPDEYVSSGGGPLPVVTESAYKRIVELPTWGSITSSGLSLREFSLGAALVLTRDSHHKRNRGR